VPELRITNDELWQRVKQRKAELAKQFGSTIEGVRKARAERLNRLRRPAFPLVRPPHLRMLWRQVWHHRQ
jgi:site-specific DNA recombinase